MVTCACPFDGFFGSISRTYKVEKQLLQVLNTQKMASSFHSLKKKKKKLYDCVAVVAAAADGHVITRNITEAFFLSLSWVEGNVCKRMRVARLHSHTAFLNYRLEEKRETEEEAAF